MTKLEKKDFIAKIENLNKELILNPDCEIPQITSQEREVYNKHIKKSITEKREELNQFLEMKKKIK
jgi:hypothetical protein